MSVYVAVWDSNTSESPSIVISPKRPGIGTSKTSSFPGENKAFKSFASISVALASLFLKFASIPSLVSPELSSPAAVTAKVSSSVSFTDFRPKAFSILEDAKSVSNIFSSTSESSKNC